MRHPRIFGCLIRVHYRHTVIHHGLTFARDHVTQFLDAADKERVDAIIATRGDPLIEKERYGLTIGLRGLVSYNVTVLPILPVLYWLCGFVACLGALPVLLAAPLLAMLVHPYLHLPHSEVLRRCPRPMAHLLGTRLTSARSLDIITSITSTSVATSIFSWAVTCFWVHTARRARRTYA